MIFLRESSPHMRECVSTARIMFMVLVGLAPAVAVHILSFGFGLMWNLLICTVWASLLEAGVYLLRRRNPLEGLKDFSLQVTVWLYCLAIPPYLSWWMTLLGMTFAVLIVKHAFGGLGQNTFNPAMAGFLFLLISVPSAMGGWVIPNTRNMEIYNPDYSLQMILMDHNDTKKQMIIDANDRLLRESSQIDGATYATPLNNFRELYNFQGIVRYVTPPSLEVSINTHGTTVLALAYIAGGVFLILAGYISFVQPLAFLLSMYLTGLVISMFGIKYGFNTIADWEHLFIGSTMCGAFFIITDPVSSPTTVRGKIISSAIIGSVTVIIRTFGSYPDAIAFAALLGNSFNPLINKLAKPRRFGARRARA
ncbi:MAG: RnfABCDGE type electron transport complex subunit D [Succinivibrionaceae bacterium]|nr:RnfABCDGE type electron transport complex subunit D [Succinivibrionaceae bacterium]